MRVLMELWVVSNVLQTFSRLPREAHLVSNVLQVDSSLWLVKPPARTVRLDFPMGSQVRHLAPLASPDLSAAQLVQQRANLVPQDSFRERMARQLVSRVLLDTLCLARLRNHATAVPSARMHPVQVQLFVQNVVLVPLPPHPLQQPAQLAMQVPSLSGRPTSATIVLPEHLVQARPHPSAKIAPLARPKRSSPPRIVATVTAGFTPQRVDNRNVLPVHQERSTRRQLALRVRLARSVIRNRMLDGLFALHARLVIMLRHLDKCNVRAVWLDGLEIHPVFHRVKCAVPDCLPQIQTASLV